MDLWNHSFTSSCRYVSSCLNHSLEESKRNIIPVLKEKSNTFLVSKSLEEGINLGFGSAPSRSSSPSVLQTGSRAKLTFINVDATAYSARQGQMSPSHNSYFTEMNGRFSITSCCPSKANWPHQFGARCQKAYLRRSRVGKWCWQFSCCSDSFAIQYLPFFW